MKTVMMAAVVAFMLLGIVNFSQAENTKITTAAEKSHHVGNDANLSDSNDQMGMKSMMHDCMKMNKDHKTCQQENMKSCEAKMGKKECAQIMKNMKMEKN